MFGNSRMQAWRLCRAPYADLNGEGARRFGGRWNAPGRAVVYAAADPALCVLDVCVHLDVPPGLLPDDYVLLRLELPDDSVETLSELPADPGGFGDAWLAEGRSAVLRVPSAIVAESANLLLNVAHPHAVRARVVSTRRFAFDARLWMAG